MIGLGLSITQLAVRQMLGGTFNPLDLFANSEPGFWYDPSDMSTLFQDASGATPVTAVEQPVGLMLDKSGNGAHATQATATSRPVLSARVNLLTKTEQFDDGVGWAKTIAGTGTAPIVTDLYTEASAPDGTFTASRLRCFISGTSSGDISGLQKGSGAVLSTLAGRIWVKSNTASLQTAWFRAGGSQRSVTVTTSWTQITDTGTIDYFSIGLRGSISGAGLLDILLWHPDQRVANDGVGLPAYQRVNTATDYDTVGFPHYLRCDGIDDWMVTPTITPGTDKVQVFAGVRKLSDAAGGSVAELNTSWLSGSGTFALFAPSPANTNIASASRGSAGAVLGQVASDNENASPITRVVAMLAEISQDQNILRINGAQAASSTQDQGAGNYGNYPLYLFRRGGTSSTFNGHFYGGIIRFGDNLPIETIEQTESYMAAKTGVTL